MAKMTAETTTMDQALRRIEDMASVLAYMRDEAMELRRRVRADRPVPTEISEVFWVWAQACQNVLDGTNDEA